ncbi:hypothetical protein DIPPA_07415 [Diplonema papillatum]|nr:hypothetical protein DIPPA_07415 [Diplonema papillatum]
MPPRRLSSSLLIPLVGVVSLMTVLSLYVVRISLEQQRVKTDERFTAVLRVLDSVVGKLDALSENHEKHEQQHHGRRGRGLEPSGARKASAKNAATTDDEGSDDAASAEQQQQQQQQQHQEEEDHRFAHVDRTKWSEESFLAIRNYTDPMAKHGAEHPELVAEIARSWSMNPEANVHELQGPIHRILDYIMVRDCDIKKKGKKGCIDGFVLPEQADKYFNWALNWESPVSVPTLCETGFNAGHSAVTFLLANRNMNMVSFDLFIQAYSSSCFKYVKAVFGDDRMTLHQGDSHASLSRLGEVDEESRQKCDVISVDGAHSFKACMKDVKGLSKLVARPGTPVLMDDTAEGFEGRSHGQEGGPAEVWHTLKSASKLKQTRYANAVHPTKYPGSPGHGP